MRNEALHVVTAFSRTALEIRSWLPQLKTGQQFIKLDGRELPRDVGATLPGSPHVLCLAPGEWLLTSDEPLPSSVIGPVAAELARQGAVLVDTTDGITDLTIRGALAGEVLAKGCGLDLHPDAFPSGRCARTRFAQMAVTIHRIDDAPTFRLYVARSYLQYLIDWIEDAAVEFNVAIES